MCIDAAQAFMALCSHIFENQNPDIRCNDFTLQMNVDACMVWKTKFTDKNHWLSTDSKTTYSYSLSAIVFQVLYHFVTFWFITGKKWLTDILIWIKKK